MLSDEVIEKVTERLVRRIEQGNEYVLEQIGKSVKKIGTLSPSKAQQLVQIMKYGGDYDKIVKKLAEITKLNQRDIKKIFQEVAKSDYEFAKQFYDYRGKKYIPYEQNTTLKNQVDLLTNQMIDDYISKTKSIGFSIKDNKGNVIFQTLEKTYQDSIDKAIISISQGKTTFDAEMYAMLKELGSSGIKTLDYASGRTLRLDSAIRMIAKDSLRQLHNEEQRIFGEQFGSNMVEVSHHSNSAPDHIDTIDGKQFARIDVIKKQIKKGEEKEIKLSDIDGNRVKVKGKWYNDFDSINNNLVRPVSTLNCYHDTFEGILGITQPEFTQEELNADKEKNLAGFDYEGKHYTMYEGTQLQRKLETEIRKQKDIQIIGKAGDNKELIVEAQSNITTLTNKYKELSKASGLPTKMDRMRVSGYKRVAKSKLV